MSWLRRLQILFALCLSVLIAGAIPAFAQHPDEEETAREILVMLRLPPPHYRPNSGYGGSYGDAMSEAARRRVAERIAKRNGLAVAEGWPMPLVGVDCVVMRLPPGMSREAAIERVSRDPMVAWSQPMNVYEGRGAADPLYRTQPAVSDWHLTDLHRLATGRGVTIAVVDSKIEIRHPDLAGQFVADRDFVNRTDAPERHGTGVAGVIAAKSGNGLGIAGVAPGARLMALRACWQTAGNAERTACDTLTLAKALHFAIEKNADVINLSLSGPPDRLLQRLIEIALDRKTAVVAAFDPALPAGGFPASIKRVVAVIDKALPSLPAQVYVAPGRDVPTTRPGGRWYLVNGSSYSAAHVSGLLALVREERGAIPASLAETAGREIDACAMLALTSRACDCSCAVDRRIAGAGRR